MVWVSCVPTTEKKLRKHKNEEFSGLARSDVARGIWPLNSNEPPHSAIGEKPEDEDDQETCMACRYM